MISIEPVGTAGEDAADEQVGNLGGRDVQHPLDQSGLDQLLHRLAAGSGRVEYQAVEALRLQLLPHRCDARGGDPEHGQPQSGPDRFGRELPGVLNHAGHGVCGVAQHLS